MALHGRIMVSGRPIGAWEARRIEARGPDDKAQEYEGLVVLHDRLWEGTVWHLYNDGALVLMTKLLEAARKEIGNGGWRT